jgi:hypothetical protein
VADAADAADDTSSTDAPASSAGTTAPGSSTDAPANTENEGGTPELEPVAPVFTPEILDQYSHADDASLLGAPATGTTAPATANPLDGEAGTSGVESPAVGLGGWRIEERDTVRLSVQDHGIGIPARDLDRIFERFYRVDHGRSRDTGGTGLGLSIVRHVANNHQGWVDVESREGEGSTFTLVLPIQAERVG